MSELAGLTDPRAFLLRLFSAAVAAVQPAVCMAAHFPPVPTGRLIVIGAGKAAAAMAIEVEKHFGARAEGLVIVPDGYGAPCRWIEVAEASHPVPDARGMAAAKNLHLAQSASNGDLVLCLISGGASALMSLPAPGVTLADKRAITSALLRSGAAINEINCVRKHLSAVKGGRLAAAAAPARVFTMVISDVVGDDPAVIASAPTVPDPSTCEDALAVIEKYRVPIADKIRQALAHGSLEIPKTGQESGVVRIVARPRDALEAAAAVAQASGIEIWNLGDRCDGDVRAGARMQAMLVQDILAGRGPVRTPSVVLSGGEYVVTVTGAGRGGPNTEFALALAVHLDGLPVWVLAADTDGLDGNAGVAGAIVDPGTLQRARAAGYDPISALNQNNSAGMLAMIGDLVDSGPTSTNVNDFRAILVFPDDR